jgi:uncharacterized membrane protein
MSNYVVIVFRDEAKAYEGAHALKELHDEGSITLYDTVIAQRDASGALRVKERSDLGGIRTGLGAVVDGLIGVLGRGIIAGSTTSLLDEVSGAFAEDITKQMAPGTYAVFAEVSEQWTAPLDVRAQALDGKVLREPRVAAVDDLLERRVHAHRAAVDERTAARETRKAEDLEARYEIAVEEARARLQRTADKARQRLDDTKHEVQKKLLALHRQAEKAKPEVKQQIEQRISELSAEFAERERKLSHAYELAQEALRPAAVA